MSPARASARGQPPSAAKHDAKEFASLARAMSSAHVASRKALSCLVLASLSQLRFVRVAGFSSWSGFSWRPIRSRRRLLFVPHCGTCCCCAALGLCLRVVRAASGMTWSWQFAFQMWCVRFVTVPSRPLLQTSSSRVVPCAYSVWIPSKHRGWTPTAFRPGCLGAKYY